MVFAIISQTRFLSISKERKRKEKIMRSRKIRLEVRSPLASSEMFADFLRANNIEMVWETGRGHPQNAMFYGTKEALEQLVWDFFNTGSWNEDYPIDYSNDDFAEFIYLMERVGEDNGKLREARYFLYGQYRNNAYDIDAGAPIWDKKKFLVKEFYASTEEKAKEFLKNERKKIPRGYDRKPEMKYTMGLAKKASQDMLEASHRQDLVQRIKDMRDPAKRSWFEQLLRDYRDIPTDHLDQLLYDPPELTTESDEYISASVGASVWSTYVKGSKEIEGVNYSVKTLVDSEVNRV